VGLSPETGSALASSGGIKKEQLLQESENIYTQGCPCSFTSLTCVPVRDYSAALCINMWGDFFFKPYLFINRYILCKLLLQAETK